LKKEEIGIFSHVAVENLKGLLPDLVIMPRKYGWYFQYIPQGILNELIYRPD